jgi:hypothetical protein
VPSEGSRWCVKVGWSSDDVTDSFEDFGEAARLTGLQFACLRGVRTVRVFDPAGELVHSYDRADNTWRGAPAQEKWVPRAE